MRQVKTRTVAVAAAVLLAGAGVGMGHGEPPAAVGTAPKDAPVTGLRLLESMCGEFDVTYTAYPRPGAEPMTIKATAVREMILGGKILQQRIEATEGPMPFSTMIHTAYNAGAKGGGRFEVNRMSSMGSCMMPERGTFDPETRTFNLEGSHEINGMTGTCRVVHRLLDDGKESADVYLGFEGFSEEFKGMTVPEYKAMVVEYARKRAK